MGSCGSLLGCLLKMSSSKMPKAATGNVLITSARLPATTGAGVTSQLACQCMAVALPWKPVVPHLPDRSIFRQHMWGSESTTSHVLQENMLCRFLACLMASQGKQLTNAQHGSKQSPGCPLAGSLDERLAGLHVFGIMDRHWLCPNAEVCHLHARKAWQNCTKVDPRNALDVLTGCALAVSRLHWTHVLVITLSDSHKEHVRLQQILTADADSTVSTLRSEEERQPPQAIYTTHDVHLCLCYGHAKGKERSDIIPCRSSLGLWDYDRGCNSVELVASLHRPHGTILGESQTHPYRVRSAFFLTISRHSLVVSAPVSKPDSCFAARQVMYGISLCRCCRRICPYIVYFTRCLASCAANTHSHKRSCSSTNGRVQLVFAGMQHP